MRRPAEILTSFGGALLIIVAPVLALLGTDRLWGTAIGPYGYLRDFVVAIVFSQLALIVKRAGQRPGPARLAQDGMVAVVASLGTWMAVRLSAMRGGGPVDPSFLALLASYILVLWP